MNKLLVHKTGLINPKHIKFDKSNPNVMSEQKYESLKQVIIKYGFGDTVKIDADGTCIDGEHKTRVAIDLEIPKIPFTKFTNINTALDRKMLRNIFNKLRGEHDEIKDAQDFKFIQSKGELEEFASLMGEEIELFENEIEKLELADIIPDPEELEETIINSMKITFEYNTIEDYELVLIRLKAINQDKEAALLQLVSLQ